MRKKLIMLLVAVMAIAAMLVPTVASAAAPQPTAYKPSRPYGSELYYGAYPNGWGPDVWWMDIEIDLMYCEDSWHGDYTVVDEWHMSIGSAYSIVVASGESDEGYYYTRARTNIYYGYNDDTGWSTWNYSAWYYAF